MTTTSGSNGAWWAAAAMTAVNALVSAGYSVAALAAVPVGNPAAHVASMYAAARSVPLALVVLALIALRASRGLAALAVVMTMVQVADAVIGITLHELPKTLGPAVSAALTAAGIRTLWRGERAWP